MWRTCLTTAAALATAVITARLLAFVTENYAETWELRARSVAHDAATLRARLRAAHDEERSALTELRWSIFRAERGEKIE